MVKPKPCEAIPNIRCKGPSGTCFGWLFWGVPYGKKPVPPKKWERAEHLERCPYAAMLREKWKRGKI